MTWLSSSGRGVSFGGFSVEHGARKRAQSADLRGLVLNKSRFSHNI